MHGKGGFAVSFYVQLQNETQLARTAKVSTVRGVRKLRCGLQSLLVIQGARPHNLCAENVLSLLESIGQQPPTASFSGSDYKSPLPLGISVPANTNVQV